MFAAGVDTGRLLIFGTIGVCVRVVDWNCCVVYLGLWGCVFHYSYFGLAQYIAAHTYLLSCDEHQ